MSSRKKIAEALLGCISKLEDLPIDSYDRHVKELEDGSQRFTLERAVDYPKFADQRRASPRGYFVYTVTVTREYTPFEDDDKTIPEE
jgi:hypothetical protein